MKIVEIVFDDISGVTISASSNWHTTQLPEVLVLTDIQLPEEQTMIHKPPHILCLILHPN